MFNYFKEAERVLSERGSLERALENLTRRRAQIVAQGAPAEFPDIPETYVSAGTVRDALSDCLDVAEITREIETTRAAIAEVDRVLEQLADDNASILRAWYIEKASKEDIAERFSYSTMKPIYALRNKAVSAFAILYFGAGALAST